MKYRPRFLYGVPRSVLQRVIDEECREKGFSELGARVSLLLDVDKGDILTKTDYAKIWGWTRNKVRYHWASLWKDIALWSISFGRQPDGPLAENLPDKWRDWAIEHAPIQPPPNNRATTGEPPDNHRATTAKPAHTDENQQSTTGEPPNNHHSTTALQPPDHHHTIHPSSLHPLSQEKDTRPSGQQKMDFDVSDALDAAMGWWNNVADEYNLPGVRARNDTRRKGIKKRFKKVWPLRDQIEKEIKQSSFLRGESDRGWRVDFDFIFCSTDGYTKILEGKYRDTKKDQHSKARERDPAADYEHNDRITSRALGLK